MEKFMKAFLNPVKLSAILALLVLAAGCATTKHTEKMLSAAGFKVVVAATPRQEEKIKSLPPGKFTLTRRNGNAYYVFPDAAHNRIFLGTKREYQNYQQMLLDNKIAAQNRVDAEMAPADGAGWNDWSDWEILGWQASNPASHFVADDVGAPEL
jgi:hypothetical protein